MLNPCRRTWPLLGMALRLVARSTNIHARLDAYYAYVHSKISYGIISWSASVNTDRTFRLQKSCARNVFGLHPRTTCEDLLTLPAIYIL
ncbi:hypothetical protein Trydic_g5967 [Trypoxylus dichotomus]